MRDSFIFYRSFFESAVILNEKDQLILFKGIIDYSLNGVEPRFEGFCSSLWTLIKPLLDSNQKKYTDGLKGGRPKKEEKHKTSGSENKKPVVSEINKPVVIENENQSLEKYKTSGSQINKPNVYVNENVNVNVNERENENSEESLSHFLNSVFKFWENENIRIHELGQIKSIGSCLLKLYGYEKLLRYVSKAFTENKAKYLNSFGLLNILERIADYAEKNKAVVPTYTPPPVAELTDEERANIEAIKAKTRAKLNKPVVIENEKPESKAVGFV